MTMIQKVKIKMATVVKFNTKLKSLYVLPKTTRT